MGEIYNVVRSLIVTLHFFPWNCFEKILGLKMSFKRATYSSAALRKYFTHIQLPTSASRQLLERREGWGISSEGRNALEVLQKYQQAKIPFSNLYLHYGREKVGILEPDAWYEYLIRSRVPPSPPELPILAQKIEKIEERERLWEGRRASGG